MKLDDWVVALAGVVVGALVSVLSPFLTPLVNRWERKRMRGERQLIDDWTKIYKCTEKIRDLAYVRLPPGVAVKDWVHSDEAVEEFQWMHAYVSDPAPVKIAHRGINNAWIAYRPAAVRVLNLVFQEFELPDEALQEDLDRAQSKLGQAALSVLGGYSPKALKD